jgi:uncharacterized protein (UPF0548 family)
VFLLRAPSDSAVAAFLAAQSRGPFSYAEVGGTRGARAPAGYNVDHNRVLVGRGEACFDRAAAALRAWHMFELGWCRVSPPGAPVEAGMTVAVVINHFGFWSLNACRIVYVLEEPHVYGFAYGTLRGHGEVGEERFSVEWNRDDGSVSYDIYAFSRPGHPLARLGYPLSRMLQRRFARDSKAAMLRAVKGDAQD